MPILPPSRVFNAILNPSPSFPRRFSFGTSISSKISSETKFALMPILSKMLPTLNPFMVFSTINVLIPFAPALLSVTAKTMMMPALGPLVIKVLSPFIMYLFPFRTAVVCMAPRSEPALGSVPAKAPIFSPLARMGRYFFFCSSVPYFIMG